MIFGIIIFGMEMRQPPSNAPNETNNMVALLVKGGEYC
jgi:hypothetical protein